MFKFAKTLFFIFLTLGSTSVAHMAESHLCPVCCSEESSSSLFQLSCGHDCCLDCLSNMIQRNVEVRVYPRCPYRECRQPLSREDLGCLMLDSALMKKLEYLELATQPESKPCPTHSCFYTFINEDVEVRIIQCPECHLEYCCQCLRMHNPRISCKKAERQAEMDEAQKSQESERASKEWIAQNSKICPRCKTPILKNGGCNKVTCTKCGTVIRWNPEKKHP